MFKAPTTTETLLSERRTPDASRLTGLSAWWVGSPSLLAAGVNRGGLRIAAKDIYTHTRHIAYTIYKVRDTLINDQRSDFESKPTR